jgi:MFS superfamily sulfate permease-like transporter
LKRYIRLYRRTWLRYDLPAGLSVFLVALPLCLGISLASGAPLYAGLLSGIVGGIIVSMISGSQLSVSGPAAGLSTVVAASIISYGDYRIFMLAVIIAGAFQIVLGILKLGVIGNYFPSAVIKGMLAAIGILLIARQVPVALGYDQPDFWRSGLSNFVRSSNLQGNIHLFNMHISRGAVIISGVSLSVMIILQQPFAKKLKIIPAPLLAVAAGILVNYFFSHSSSGLTLKPTQLVQIPNNVLGSIRFPDFSKLFTQPGLWKDGIVIGLLASLETLLCVEAIDKLDQHNRITPLNRELVAQGVGNMTCGFLGGLPMTAVIVRGAANVDAGGRTRLSAFTHGLFLLLAVLLIPFVLNKIPYASLASVLLVTGYNLARPKLFRNMLSLGVRQFLPFILTIVIILATDLLTGVMTGLLISTFYIIKNNFRAEYHVHEKLIADTMICHIKLNSNVTFLNKVKLKDALDHIPPNSKLSIDGSECNFIDYDILEIISEFENKARERKIEVHLHGIRKVNVTAIH